MCFVVQCCKPPLEITVRSIWLVAAFSILLFQARCNSIRNCGQAVFDASHFHHASTIASHVPSLCGFHCHWTKKGTRFVYAEDLARQRDVTYSSYLNMIIWYIVEAFSQQETLPCQRDWAREIWYMSEHLNPNNNSMESLACLMSCSCASSSSKFFHLPTTNLRHPEAMSSTLRQVASLAHTVTWCTNSAVAILQWDNLG